MLRAFIELGSSFRDLKYGSVERTLTKTIYNFPAAKHTPTQPKQWPVCLERKAAHDILP